MAKALVPLALLFILAACGGSAPRERIATHRVGGDGFSFAAPGRWRVAHGPKGVVARRSTALVSATRFTLLKPYDPARFDRVVVELDRDAAKLAAEAGGTVTKKETTTVDGRKIRAYSYNAGGYVTRIGFVLDGKREVQLLCRARSGSDDPDGACALLFRTFALS